ncbi:MAG: hypothetical protein IAE97_05285 [Chthoniobacterales bacterium]|nr:hypothetical protein [Chthoniobacterales bacterium]
MIAYPMVGGTVATVWVLVASQLLLLVREVSRGQVTGVGGFLFMSFLFFGVRPIYMVMQSDYSLFTRLFLIRADMESVTSAMWWASAATFCFAVGADIAPRIFRRQLARRHARNARPLAAALVTNNMVGLLLGLQLITLPIMLRLAGIGRGVYGSSAGAYFYDLPVPLQAIHIMGVLVILQRYMQRRDAVNLALLSVSGLMLLYFTWLMRDVTLFRGFYVAGLMVAGLTVIMELRGRAGYAWLILPVVILQPFFQHLGQARGVQNEEFQEESVLEQVAEEQTLSEAYWNFYRSNGDMNIFDTFAAAKAAEPSFYPYVWSWAYVPLHLIPRTLWSGKPPRGVTQDLRFLRGAPYSPGVAGFFLLDGGLVWMLLSMLVLGFLISLLDWFILTMPRGYLRYLMVGIITVNAMFLTRFFLWQYFYQMMYAMIPILALAWFFRRHQKRQLLRARSPKLGMANCNEIAAPASRGGG